VLEQRQFEESSFDRVTQFYSTSPHHIYAEKHFGIGLRHLIMLWEFKGIMKDVLESSYFL
jgi:hypothetical protein